MATPREILKTKHDELVLETFFNEYIVPWYREKAITAVLYDKARQEIENLRKTKKAKGKKKNQENIKETIEEDVRDVRSFPGHVLKVSKANAQKRETLARSSAAASSSQSRTTQSKPGETKQTDKQQTNRKEEVDLQRLLSENNDLKGRLEEMKAKISKTRADADVELRVKEQQLERLRKALENSVEQVNTQSKPGETKQTDKQQTNRKEGVDFQRLLSENNDLKGRLEEMKAKISKTRADADVELRDKEQQLERLRKALENSVEQVNTLTLRLSKLAGDKLRQGNPDLADLSDPNRPTELGTRFSEIYDNEWSDAFEHIPIQDEEKRVRVLHGIVMAAFSFCYLKFEEQTCQVRATMLCLEQEAISADPSSDKTIRTTQIHNVLSDLRKQTSSETSKNVANEFLSVKFEQFITGFGLNHREIHPTLREYARKCAEICWFMMVCDPHMTLSEDKEGAEFDTNVYKPYTQSVRNMKRPIIKLNVWPALRLHMSGPLVARGVAQPVEGKAN